MDDEQVPIRARSELAAFLNGSLTLAEIEGLPHELLAETAERGRQLLENGKVAEAKGVFQGLHALNPYDAYTLMALGSVAQCAGSLEEAEAWYSRALEINPCLDVALVHRGELRVSRGAIEAGLEDLVQVIEGATDLKAAIVQRAVAITKAVADELPAT